MKSALITGSAGFIGSHMAVELVRRGWKIDTVDLITGSDALDAYRADVYYDLVVHCAYTVGGRKTIDGLNMVLADNLTLDSALFKYAVRVKPGAVMYYSSSAAYPTYIQTKECHRRLREEDLNLELGQPDANYGFAKVAGERLAKAASELGVRVHVLRPFSGYGEGQSLDYPFPSIIRRAKMGDLSVWGPSGQTRDWVHCDDVINASLAVYEHDERRPVNICTGIGTEMGHLMAMARNMVTGYLPVDVKYDESKPMGVFHRVGDPTRLYEHYKPTITIEEGIQRALKGGERL